MDFKNTGKTGPDAVTAANTPDLVYITHQRKHFFSHCLSFLCYQRYGGRVTLAPPAADRLDPNPIENDPKFYLEG